ncbi:MAG: glycosyltransferase family 2 protein [bacterium]|nr:glycosyltransferase family 2 protein [bacterium]
MFSVIIPVYQEEEIINKVINYLKTIPLALEIIVVDGYKESTISVIKDRGVIKLKSPVGRAKQMNKGAIVAKGETLLFLHADTLIPKDAFTLIAASKVGAFKLRFNTHNLWFRFLAFATNLRVTLTKIPYGDQAIFIRKNYFEKLGGFKDILIMEDVDLMQRVKQDAGKIKIIPKPVTTSVRRWQEKGVILTTLKNNIIRILYFCGVSPEVLAKIY